MKKSITKTILLGLIFIFLIQCKPETKEEIKMPRLDNYLIAYNVLVDESSDDYDVFVVDPLTKKRQNITNNPDVAWSYISHEDKVLFVSDRDSTARRFFLYEMDTKGNQIKRRNDFLLTDSWMSVQNKSSDIIVKASPKVDTAFYILNRAGERLKRIQPNLRYFSDPCFINQGNAIAFRGANASSKREKSFEDAIYTSNLDGEDLMKLTTYPKNDTTAAWYAYKAAPPKWQSKDEFISYASFQDGKYKLFGVKTDGTDLGQIIDIPYSVVYHDWTPDGEWLVMDVTDSNESRYDIALMHWPTKHLEILTDSTYVFQQGPSFVKR